MTVAAGDATGLPSASLLARAAAFGLDYLVIAAYVVAVVAGNTGSPAPW